MAGEGFDASDSTSVRDFGDCLLECHVTTDPPAGPADAALLDMVAASAGFRRAKLLKESGDPAGDDAFFTSHGRNFVELEQRAEAFCRALPESIIRRVKIEAVLVDRRLR